MIERTDGPPSFAALRGALHGREPPPAAVVARSRSYRWLVVGTVSIGSFMSQVDASIVQILLPTLEQQFGATLSGVTWVSVAYLLVMAAFLPIFGRLADMVGRKLLYISGFLLFVLGSALCGMATSLPLLVGFRGVQALGAALLAANSVAMLVAAAGPERRGRAIGIQAASAAVGLSVGPTLGGLLIQTLGWQWVFWINVPVGLVGTAAAWFVLPQTDALGGDRRFDWLGALLIAPALTSLLVVLNEGQSFGVLSPTLLGIGALAIVLVILFAVVERHASPPLVDLRLFGNGAFVSGLLASVAASAVLFGTFFLMGFVFMRGYGDSALTAGLRLSIIAAGVCLVAPLSGMLYDRFGARVLTITGMTVCFAGLVLLFIGLGGSVPSLVGSTTTAGSSMTLPMAALALVGIGQGLFTAPNNSAIMTTVPGNLTGEAAALLNVMRALGTSIGVAATNSLLSSQLQAATGVGNTTVSVAAADLLTAAPNVVLYLAALAVLAIMLSFVRSDAHGSARVHARVG